MNKQLQVNAIRFPRKHIQQRTLAVHECIVYEKGLNRNIALYSIDIQKHGKTLICVNMSLQ